MEKIKKLWQKLVARKKINKKQKLILTISMLLILAILYLVVQLLSVSEAEIALAKLRQSLMIENNCHEECSTWRQNEEKIIVLGINQDLKKGKHKLEKIIMNYFSNSMERVDFKKELIRIIFLTYGPENIPTYFKEYVAKPKADPALVSEIMSRFNFNDNDNETVSQNLINEMNDASSTPDKIQIMQTLREFNTDRDIDNYFTYLNSDETIKFKRELIKNISAVHDKQKYLNPKQMEIINKLIFAPETNISLRRDLILLLADYYPLYPDESKKIWQKVQGDETMDNISRLFSADNLNHFTGTAISLPVVSSEQWADYYNQ